MGIPRNFFVTYRRFNNRTRSKQSPSREPFAFLYTVTKNKYYLYLGSYHHISTKFKQNNNCRYLK